MTQANADMAPTIAVRRRDGCTMADTAIDMILGAARECASLCERGKRRLLDFTENERTVRAAKAERILHRDVNWHVASDVGAVIEIASRILIEDVDSRR